MTNKNPYSISLSKIYNVTSEKVLSLFRDNTVFKLTGADDIQSDFKTGGSFRLTFNNRGVIYGQFMETSGNRLTLEWNVESFQRPTETGTIVEISLQQDKENCILTLEHTNIPLKESADAKQKAWAEILDDIEKELTLNE